VNSTALALLQTFVAMSVFYVWVVRYPAVLADFTSFGLPDWIRDLVGASKLTAAFLLLGLGPIDGLEVIGAAGIVFFMAVALGLHLKVKNALSKMLPSIGLGVGAAVVLVYQMGWV
jgi:hypothetical protein